MRFRLLEDVPPISSEDKNKFKRGDNTTRYQIVQNLVNNWRNPNGVYLIKDLIKDSTFNLGIDPKKNLFLQVIGNLKFNIEKKYIDNLKQLSKFLNANKLDVNQDWLKEKPLYNVPTKDFLYTVRLFDIVINSAKLSQFFHNTENISIEQLYNKNGEIKPKGTENDGIDTLMGTVESWSGNDGENDKIVDKKEREDNISNYITNISKGNLKNGPAVNKLESIYKQTKNLTYDEFIKNKDYQKEGNILFINYPNKKNSGFYKFEKGKLNPFDTINGRKVLYKYGINKE